MVFCVGNYTFGSSSSSSYTGVWPSLVRMWKEEGFAGFMKGNGINVVRVSEVRYPRSSVDEVQILPYSALQFTVSPVESHGVILTLLSPMVASRPCCGNGLGRMTSQVRCV